MPIRPPISIAKLIGNRWYRVYEVDAEIIDALERRSGPRGLDAAFLGVDNYTDRVWRALGAPNESESQEVSRGLLLDTLHAEPGLNPYLFTERLQDFQADREFYDHYREHIAHQLKVYLLGWYIYANCTPFREVMDEWLPGGADDAISAFRVRWRTAALWHDIGYVFERSSVANTEMIPQQLVEELREFADAPLTATLKSKHIDGLTPVLEDQLHDAAGGLLQWVPRAMAKLEGPDGAYLKVLDEASRDLSTEDPPRGISRYYAFARGDGAVNGRPPFYDHGISGALLLLSLHSRLNQACESALRALDSPPPGLALPPGLEDSLRALERAVDSAGTAVEDAAQAIALHNIYTTGIDAIRINSLTLTFRIRCDERPLAFLLVLCDILQGWDRPGFSAARLWSSLASNQDVLICADERGIGVSLRSQGAAREDTIKRDLGNVLPADDLERLCRWSAEPSESLTTRAREGVELAPLAQSHDLDEAAGGQPGIVAPLEAGAEPGTAAADEEPVEARSVAREGKPDPAHETMYEDAASEEQRGNLREAWQSWRRLRNEVPDFKDVKEREALYLKKYRLSLLADLEAAIASYRIDRARHALDSLDEADPEAKRAAEEKLAYPCRGPAEVEIPRGPYWVGLDADQARLIARSATGKYNIDLGNEKTKKNFLATLQESGRHQVDGERFWLDVHPVTNDQFTRFVVLTSYRTEAERRGERDWLSRFTRADLSSHPVVFVTNADAEAYASWAGRRLPTAEEWNRAARGIDGLAYPWGNNYDAANCNGSDNPQPAATSPVNQFASVESPFGVIDLIGNVYEITSSRKDDFPIALGASWKRICEIYGLPNFHMVCVPGEGADEVGFRTARD